MTQTLHPEYDDLLTERNEWKERAMIAEDRLARIKEHTKELDALLGSSSEDDDVDDEEEW